MMISGIKPNPVSINSILLRYYMYGPLTYTFPAQIIYSHLHEDFIPYHSGDYWNKVIISLGKRKRKKPKTKPIKYQDTQHGNINTDLWEWGFRRSEENLESTIC